MYELFLSHCQLCNLLMAALSAASEAVRLHGSGVSLPVPLCELLF
jgi:hypothetical protein